MKKFITKIGLILLFWLAAMSNIYAQCPAPSNVSVFSNHFPNWYSVSIGWDAPDTGKKAGKEIRSEKGAGSVVLYNRGVGTGYISVICKTTLGATATFSEMGTMSTQIQCMEYVNGVLYAVDNGANGRFGYLEPQQPFAQGAGGFYLINTDLPQIASMAWNPLTSEMYATLWGGNESSGYGKINVETGEYTPIGTVPGIFTIAIDNNGVCYAVKIGNTGKFGTLNLATGMFTQIANYSENLAYYQNIEVDRETNELYWNRRINGVTSGNAVLYKIDKTTGDLTTGPILMGSNFPATAFGIMDAPNANTPKYNIYRDGVKLNTQPLFTNFYRDLAPNSGTFNYCVTAVYDTPSCESAQACAAPFVMPSDDCSDPMPLPLSEGFNKASNFPPYCWTRSSTSNSIWSHSTAGSWPACNPQEGTGMIRFDSNNANSGSKESLITPAFQTEGKDQILSFWMYRNSDNPAAIDKINIYVNSAPNITGLTPLTTIHRSTLLSPVVEADGWYQYHVNLPCSAMETAYVLFEGYSDFGRNIYMDNFAIGDLCVPVQGVTASLYGSGSMLNHAHIVWTAPSVVSASLTGYNVYRNDVQIANNINVLEYDDAADLPAGTYMYSVKAVYNNTCGMSEAKYSSSLMVTNACPDIAIPANLQAETQVNEWYDVNLSWENPVKKELFYSKSHDTELGGNGGVACTFTMASRWKPEDQTRINGSSLDRISFVPGTSTCTYTVKIWQGGTAIDNPGTLVLEQPLNTASLTINQWNEVTLTTPVTIDASKELWIGVLCNVQSGYPGGVSDGTVLAGYSDLTFWTTGEWTTLSAMGISFNWCVGATVRTNTGSEEVLGYNIYRDNTLLNTTEYVQEPAWQDRVPGAGTYLYEVSALYDNFCESATRAQVTVNMIESPCETPVQGLTEGFEGDRFPSWCWENISATASPWTKITGMGIQPECYPIEGNAMAQFNSRNYTAGKSGLLITPLFETGQRYNLSFWMTRDDAYAAHADKLNIYLSDKNEITGLTPVLTVHRHVGLPPVVTENLWYQYNVEVNTTGMDAAYFIFEGVTAYGGNIYIDQVKVEKLLCSAPENITVSMSYPGSCSALISWTAPADGSGMYNVYRDDVRIASNITATSYTDSDFTAGSHTWCVKAVCGSDESTGICAIQNCTVPSFTITASTDANGTISPSGNQTVPYGDDMEFTFTANTGYETDMVLIDGVNNLVAVSAGSYTFENVTENHTISVSFKQSTVIQPDANGIFYVKTDGTGNGASWASACASLQAAINAAVAGNQIWVAAGTYHPTQKVADEYTWADGSNPVATTDRHRAFVMKKDVKIYGGFAGTESLLAERSLSDVNASVLSGDFDGNDDGAPAGNNTTMSENAYHVVIFAGDAGNASIDGFTISGGFANGFNNYTMVNSSLIEQRCGGGMYCDASSPALTNVIVKGNFSAPNGGGMYNNNSSSPVLTNMLFTGNVDQNGAGNAIYNRASSPVLSNVTIVGNKPGASGNAIYNANSAYNANPPNSPSSPVIRNSIIFNNGTGASVYNANPSSVTYSNTYAQGIAATTAGIILANISNPIFEDAANGDFRLKTISPCINAGNNSFFDAGQTPDLSAVTSDLTGNPRISNATIDLGAYEFQDTPIIFTPDANGVIFVTEQGDGLKDGSSWNNAAEGLANVLFLAPTIDGIEEIWVKEGTYKPEHIAGNGTTSRDRAFVMTNNVKIYGSFAGTETSLSERLLSGGVTSILTGDLTDNDDGTDATLADNAYHVVVAAGAVGIASLDGFVITKGYGNATGTITVNGQTSIGQNDGAGIFMKASSPALTNLVITGNRSFDQGGGMHLYTALPVMTNVTISGNTANNGTTGGMGGGMYLVSNSHATLTNVAITGNTACVSGGGIHAASSPVLTNVLISENKAVGTNTGVNGNGGGINVASGSPVLTNVTITGNTAKSMGGGLNTSVNSLQVRNSIIYANDTTNIHATSAASTYSYCLIGGSNWKTMAIDGGNNMDADPLFADAANGDFHLKTTSPCINAGSNTFFDAGQTPDLSAITTDLERNQRIYNTIIDLGVYENQTTQYVITATAGAGGSIDPSGSVSVIEGADQTFTIIPDACYEIDQILVDNDAVTISGNTYTFEDVTENHTIEITFNQIQYSITASSGAGGSINPDGTVLVNCGADQTFTFAADSGYEIADVLIDGTTEPAAIIAGSYTFENVAGNHSIEVLFEETVLPIYTVSVSASPTVGGSVTGGGAYNSGTEATVTATANTHYNFVNWTENDIEVSTDAAYNFIVTGNRTLIANFTPVTYTITATTGAGGNIAPSGNISIVEGADQTFTFTANSGYQIFEVLIDGVNDPDAAAAGSYTFANVDDNHNIHVTFAALEAGEYTILVTYGLGGSVSPNGQVHVAAGASQTFKITPQQGYRIDRVWVDEGYEGDAVTTGFYTFENVAGNHTLSVTFTYTGITQYFITASTSTGGGAISPSGKILVNIGDDKTFTLTPQTGYRVKEVLIDGINNPDAIAAESYTFENIIASHTITAKFEKQNFIIAASVATAGGTIFLVGETSITYGGSKSYTITPQAGYMIDEVLIDGINDAKAVTSGKYTFSKVADNHTISASFRQRTYEITATAGEGGSIAPEGVTEVIHGNGITYTIVPDATHIIKSVLINGKNNAAAVSSGTYTFTNVTAKQTIAATFALKSNAETEYGEEGYELALYPNPTTGAVNIESGDMKVEAIQVFDMIGRRVLDKKAESVTTHKIDLSLLPSGIYFVKVKTDTDVIIRKIVKQ